MAVWTPGSYLVREYARNVEGVAAQGGRRQAAGGREGPQEPLEGRRRGGMPRASVVTYRVYCREMGVQTSWIDARLRPDQRRGDVPDPAPTRSPRPHEVTLVPPSRLAPVDHRDCPPPPAASRTATSPPTSTPWSTARSMLGNPNGLRVRRRRQAALPGQRGGGRRLGRPPVGPGRRGDRQGRAEPLGPDPL